MSQMTRMALAMASLLVVAAGVGLYAWQGVYVSDQKAAAKKEQAAHLVPPPLLLGSGDAGAKSGEFQSLTIVSGGDRTVLERSATGEWKIISPISARADRVTIDAITSQLKQARFKSTIDEHPDPASLEKYGLDHPVFQVEAVMLVDQAPQTLKLEGGIENSFDGSIFMRRNGEPTVYAAEGGVRYTLARSTLELRDKQVLAIDEPKLTGLTVKSRANDWALERSNGLWSLVRPTKEFADPTQISGMLGTLSNEKAQEFPSDLNALRPLFDRPILDATLTFQGLPNVRLRFARPAGDAGDALYVLREDGDGTTLARLKSSALELDRNPFDFKDKSVLRFKRDQVTGIVLQSSAGTVVLAKDAADASADTWRLLSPQAGKAKAFKVASLLWTLSSFKAQSWGEEKPKDWSKFGVDAKARSITLLGEGEVELAKLTIGKDVPGKAGTFFIRGTKDQVAESDGSRFNELPWALTDLLDVPDSGTP